MKISLEQAAKLLKQGEVIGSSTDTVFGMLVKFDNPSAVEKLYSLKERDRNKPLILLVANMEEVREQVLTIPPLAQELIDRFWPGPLTIIFPSRCGGTIAIRMPKHPLLTPLLSLVGPVFAPSLNKSGEKVLQTVEEIENEFGEEFPILCDESSAGNIPSTLIEVKGEEIILHREGAIPYNLFAKNSLSYLG